MSTRKSVLLTAFMMIEFTKVVVRHTYPLPDHSSPLLIKDLWPPLVRKSPVFSDTPRKSFSRSPNAILKLERPQKSEVSQTFKRNIASYIMPFTLFEYGKVSLESSYTRVGFNIDIQPMLNVRPFRITLKHSHLLSTFRQFLFMEIAA